MTQKPFPTEPNGHDSRRWRGLRIGVFGGSFDPPHKGHMHVAKTALRLFDLDFVWWVVSPLNPLKAGTGNRPMFYEERAQLCRTFIGRHPRMLVCTLEKLWDCAYSWQTVKRLGRAYPQTDFLWVTGYDNILNFHKWENWRDIQNHIAMAHLARPPAKNLVRRVPALQRGDVSYRVTSQPTRPALQPRTVFRHIIGRTVNTSSSDIRRGRG